jgi:hypothetical protein
MITPDEQGIAKAVCLVVGLVAIYVYIVVLVGGGILAAKGDK